MALPKLYDRIIWHNDTEPALNEDNLNSMSKGLSDVDDRLIELAGTIMEDVPVIQHDLEILEPAIENIDANVARAETAADDAEAEALKSEGYAIGTQDGVEVTSGEYYQNNAKYYAEIANPPIENTVDFTDIITISDAINKAAKDVRLKVEAVQDLHGYDKPWVGGAGKNKLPNTASSTTTNGVTFTVNTDGSVKVSTGSGGATANTQYILVDNFNLPTGNYVLNGCPSGGSSSSYLIGWRKNTTWQGNNDTGSGANISVDNADTLQFQIYIQSGAVITSPITFEPMISVSGGDYEPYENICPISGWDNAKVTRAGKNLANLIQGTLNVNTGEWTSSNTRVVTDFVRVEPNKKYKASTNGWAVRNGCYYNKDKEFLFGNTESCYPNVSTNILTVPNNADIAFVRIIYSHSNTSENCSPADFWYQLEAGETATAYEPYMGEVFTINLDGTRYGGILDVTSGVLTLTYGEVDLGTITWEKQDLGGGFYNFRSSTPTDAKKVPNSDVANLICSQYYATSVDAITYTSGTVNGAISIRHNSTDGLRVRDTAFDNSTADQFKTAMNGVQLVYELATPQTIQLTPTQVYLLYGYNTLFGDCGDISLTYDASGIIHIEEAKLDTETLKTIAAASSDFADFKARIAAL